MPVLMFPLGGDSPEGFGPMIQREETVMVWDRPWTITIYRKSKNVWVVVGEYMGTRIEVKDSTPSTAAKRWKEAALYRDNIDTAPR